MAKKTLYVARMAGDTYTKVEGIAKSGEVSPQGILTTVEDREGRQSVTAGPAAIRYVMEPDGRIRRKTIKEMIRDGQWRKGVGPVGVRRMP